MIFDEDMTTDAPAEESTEETAGGEEAAEGGEEAAAGGEEAAE